MRRAAILAFVSSIGCTYPEFHFAPRDDGASAIEDSTSEDSAVVIDTSLDTFAPPSDTGAPDTSVADSAKDTAMPVDVAPDVPVSTGCAGVVAKYCFDWDKATKPDDGFSFFGVDSTGTIGIEAGGGRSLPNAFLATTAPGAGAVVRANVTRLITTATADTLIKFDAWIKLERNTFPGTDGAFLFKIQRDGGTGDGVTFSMDSTGLYVDRIGVTYEYFPLTFVPKASTWMHVRMHTRIHTTAGSVTVWIDNISTPVLSRSAISTCKADSTAKSVIVGLYSQGSTGTLRARYDDVTIDY